MRVLSVLMLLFFTAACGPIHKVGPALPPHAVAPARPAPNYFCNPDAKNGGQGEPIKCEAIDCDPVTSFPESARCTGVL